MTIYTRIQRLAKGQGLSIRALEEKLGFGNGTLKRWENNMPAIDKVEKVANFFDVSTDYLLGRTNNPNLPTSPKWASTKDIMDLEEMLESNVDMAFGGEELTETDKQRLKDVLTGIFWDKLQKKKGL